MLRRWFFSAMGHSSTGLRVWRRRAPRKADTRGLRFEGLEDRRVLATYTWDPAAGSLNVSLDNNESLTISETGGIRSFALVGGTFSAVGGVMAPGSADTLDFSDADNIAASVEVGNALAPAGSSNPIVFGGGTLQSDDFKIAALAAGTTSSITFQTGTTVFTGNVTLASQGGRISTATGSLRVAGTTVLSTDPSSDIQLDRTSDFVGTVSITSARNVSFQDANGLSIGAVTANDLSFVADGAVDFVGVVNLTGNLSGRSHLAASGIGAPITDNGGQLIIAGTTTLSADQSGDITLDNPANDFVGAITISAAHDVTLDDANAVTVANVTTFGEGNLTIDAGGNVEFTGLADIDGNLDVDTTANDPAGGTITDNGGQLRIVRATTLAAGAANDITLDNPANDFSGTITISAAHHVTLDDANLVTIADVTTFGAGDLTIDAGGNVEFTGLADIDGNLDVDTTANAATGGTITDNGGRIRTNLNAFLAAGTANNITLDNLDNRFLERVLVSSANDVLITLNSFLRLGATTIDGSFNFRTGNSLDVQGPVTARANSTLAGNKIVIDQPIMLAGQVLSILPVGGSDSIRIGTIGDTTPNSLELSDAELDRITAETLRIGSATSGQILVTNPGVGPDFVTLDFSLFTGGGINATDGGSISFDGANRGLFIEAAGNVALDNINDVTRLAANLTGIGRSFTFRDRDDLVIGTVDGRAGIQNPTGAVTLTGAATATGNLISAVVDGNADIVGTTIGVFVITPGSDIGASSVNRLEINASVLNASTGGTVGDDIFIDDRVGGIAAGLLNAGAGSVFLRATGGSLTSSVVDNTADIVGAALILDTTGPGSQLGAAVDMRLEVDADDLQGRTSGGAADHIFIAELSSLTAVQLLAGDADIALSAESGAIADTDAATTDFRGRRLEVTARDGIGSTARALDSEVQTLTARNDGNSGDIRFLNVQNELRLDGVTNLDGDAIDLRNLGSLIVNANRPVTSRQSVLLEAGVNGGADGDFIAEANAAVGSLENSVDIRAVGNVRLAAGAAASAGINQPTGSQALRIAFDVNHTGGNLEVLGTTGVIGAPGVTELIGSNSDNQVRVQAERLRADGQFDVDLGAGIDDSSLVIDANSALRTRRLTVNGTAGGNKSFEVDTSLDTAPRVFAVQFVADAAGAPATGINTLVSADLLAGGSFTPGRQIEFLKNDQYQFAAGTTAAPQAVVLRGAAGSNNRILGDQFRVDRSSCVEVVGRALNDFVDRVDFVAAVRAGATLFVDDNGSDEIYGTLGPDVIFGGAGADMLFGFPRGLANPLTETGDDIIFADATLTAGGRVFPPNPDELIVTLADGDLIDGGGGRNSAVSFGRDRVRSITGTLLSSGAEIDVWTWLGATFVQDQSGAANRALLDPCVRHLIDNGIHAFAVGAGGGSAGGEGESARHNSASPHDVNADGAITPLDALLVVNFINATAAQTAAGEESAVAYYYDVNDDQQITSFDVLHVVNRLNRAAGGEGEGSSRGNPLLKSGSVLHWERTGDDNAWLSVGRDTDVPALDPPRPTEWNAVEAASDEFFRAMAMDEPSELSVEPYEALDDDTVELLAGDVDQLV